MYPLYHAVLPSLMEELGVAELSAAQWVLYGLHIGLVSHGYFPANENNYLTVRKGTALELVPENLMELFKAGRKAVTLHYSRLNDHLALKVDLTDSDKISLEPILNGSVREKSEVKPSEYIRNTKDGSFVDGKLDELVRSQLQQPPTPPSYVMPMIMPVRPPIAPGFTPPDFNGMLMGPGHPTFHPRFDPIFPDNPYGRSPEGGRAGPGNPDLRGNLPDMQPASLGSNDLYPDLSGRTLPPHAKHNRFFNG